MNSAAAYTFFFQKRWPNGFECPRCGHHLYYTISTRRLPLYQCRFCRHQTTLTSGTVMQYSRTPLAKWAEAIEFLAVAGGVNAVQLAAQIGVTHKVAWTMLSRIREAISRFDHERKLQGTVHAGLRRLGRFARHVFAHSVLYPKERVIFVCGSIDSKTGEPETLKLKAVNREDFNGNLFTKDGAADFLEPDVSANAELFPVVVKPMSWLRLVFDEAVYWLNRLFNGLGSKYLQFYLNEFAFRWNIASKGLPAREAWFNVCLQYGKH